MAVFLITLPPMSKEQVNSAWSKVISASVGSEMKMDRAYVDQEKGQAICCWTAPNMESIEKLFEKAQVKPESIKQVSVYSG